MRRALGLLGLLGALLLGAPGAAAVEPICPGGASPDPNVLFCEDFEWSTAPSYEATPLEWQSRGWDWGSNFSSGYGNSGNHCNNPAIPSSFSGLCGLMFDYLPNTQGTPWPGHTYLETGGGSGAGAPIFARFYVKVSTGFVWHSNSSKMFYFFARTGGGTGTIIYRNPVFVTSNGKPFFKLYPDYTCNFTQGPSGNFLQNQGNDVALTGANQNRWFAIEAMVRNSSVDGTDGELKLWIDGVLRLHHTGVQTRGSCRSGATTGHNQLWLNAYLGGSEPITHEQQQIYYDSLVVSRAPIGLLGDPPPPPPDTTPPKAPSAFDAELVP